MTGTRAANGSRIATRRLRAALAHGLAKRFQTTCSITELRRRPSPYRTSFALEELKVRLANGDKLDLLFKDCSRQALSDEAATAKPEFLIDAKRELDVYRNWLEPAGLGTAILYAAIVDERRGTFGIVLEHVKGHEMYKIGRFDLWQATARWLAGFHAHFNGADSTTAANRLPRHDAKQCRLWLDHANHTIEKSNIAPGKSAIWKSIAAAYVTTIDRVASLPPTLIHGEFFASNVLLDNSNEELRVCPVDWEMATIGPGLLDLAALVSGSWNEEQKAALAEAYFHELQRIACCYWSTQQEFGVDLINCRLHLAVQRIAWSADWTPPAEHRYDWWAEATQLADRIAT